MHFQTRSEDGLKTVVIVGGGFAGLSAAKTLANKEGVRVYLIDRKNHHLFQPLLYQVATAGLNASDVAVPIRSQFSKAKNVEVHLGTISRVDLEERIVAHGADELEYDYLIMACGAQHAYFGHQEWEEHAPGLKTLEQALEIRRRVLNAFEQAENEMDTGKQTALLTFVVVGGGPTGVELAGAIADIARTVLVRDFKRIDPTKARILLVEALPRILGSFHEDLGKRAVQDLTKLGVEVRTGAKVDRIDAKGVQIGSEFIPAGNVIWAAGVQAAKVDFVPPLAKDRAGRVQVEANYSVPGYAHTFVIGDMAQITDTDGKVVPGLAPAAIQAGKHTAKNILASIKGEALTGFRYKDKGIMATIGKRKAIMQAGSIRMGGYFAWLAWFFIHLLYLVSFRNRVSVMAQWFWNYAFSKRGARLITDSTWSQVETTALVSVGKETSSLSPLPKDLGNPPQDRSPLNVLPKDPPALTPSHA